MRATVELHPDFVWFLKKRCTDAERKAFYNRLEEVRRKPIENSEHIRDAKLSRYMLRFFRFAGIMAVFKFDPAKNRIRIYECRKITPGRLRNENPPGKP